MGLLSWLFGSSGSEGYRGDPEPGWQESEQGNATRIIGNRRLTIFPQDEGFKFCVAKADRDDHNPHFSELYTSHADARAAGLAFVEGRPSPVVSQTSVWRDERRSRSRLYLEETIGRLKDLAGETDQARNITDLRNIERKAESTIRGLSNQLSRVLHDDLSTDDIDRAERLKAVAEQLLQRVQDAITARKAGKP